MQLLSDVALLRPDAISVWKDPQVNARLAWYRRVMLRVYPAKFKICRGIPADLDLKTSSESELWQEHERLSSESRRLVREAAESGPRLAQATKLQQPNFLDLKGELVNRMLTHCNFCEWNCKVDRSAGKIGFCRLDSTTSVGSYFHHYGEEGPLIGTSGRGGSGTIFFESCNFHCCFCQNWDISQPKSKKECTGEVVTPIELAALAENLLSEGAANINFVGGEPTIDLHTIVNSMRFLSTSAPMIWNSNFYCTEPAMRILSDIIDLWLPDFKFWNPECAKRLMWVGAKASYTQTVKRNILIAVETGDMILRHLVMPNHLECCTKPILKFLAETCGDRILVNVMAQYRPENIVLANPEKYRDISRRPTRREIQEAYDYAKSLGLVFEPIS